MPQKKQQFETVAVHAGQEFDPTTGAIIPPIYQTSTFVQDGIGGFRGGYEYARGGNPTRSSLETLVAALEGAKHGLSFSTPHRPKTRLMSRCVPP